MLTPPGERPGGYPRRIWLAGEAGLTSAFVVPNRHYGSLVLLWEAKSEVPTKPHQMEIGIQLRVSRLGVTFAVELPPGNNERKSTKMSLVWENQA